MKPFYTYTSKLMLNYVKGLLSLMFFILSIASHAQTMVQEGNVWTYCNATYNEYDSVGNHIEPYLIELKFKKYVFKGERAIGGRIYNEVWGQDKTLVRRIPSDDVVPLGEPFEATSDPYYCFSLREENGTIYGNIREMNERSGLPEYEWDKPAIPIYDAEGDEYVIYDVRKDSTRDLPFIGGDNSWRGFFILPPPLIPNDCLSRDFHLNLFFLGNKLAYQSPMFMSDPFYPEVEANATIDLTAIRNLSQSPTSSSKSSILNLQSTTIFLAANYQHHQPRECISRMARRKR